MHVLIIFGTVEGHTRKIARNVSATVQSLGHQTTVFDAGDLGDVDLDIADAVIVCAPVHMGQYPMAITHWLTTRADRLSKVPGAFVSVSLAAASPFPEEHAEIQKLTEALFERTGWRPRMVHQAGGALRYPQYDFLKRLLMKHIAYREGGPTDVTKDHEFTNWNALAAFVEGFVADCDRPAEAGANEKSVA
ncbi:flavodoxin domain-containing protein [Aquibium sp. LZ166]|uniref:Flavodoxin domain-containing protein n=1 Tax=Aquibium pacificus TaxID=3153579 RepID=A0ABV3SKD1_9HYPH